MPYQSVNPATGEMLRSFAEHTDQQMWDALAAADATYRNSWSKVSCKERATHIARAAALMLEQKEALARLATLEIPSTKAPHLGRSPPKLLCSFC